MANIGANAVDYDQGGTGAIVRSVESRLQDYVSVRDFGATGDGSTDDTDALRNAINFAQGRKVYLEGEKTYRINQSLEFTTDVHLESDIAKATIYHAGQSINPLNVHASETPITTTTLTTSMQRGNKIWNLASAAGVESGLLMEVVSSESWYHDPRPETTDARKSELHKVARVNGTSVVCEDVANDGYNINNETVTVSFYRPIKVTLKNIIVRAIQPEYAQTTPAIVGLTIKRADFPRLENVDIYDCCAVGVKLIQCYRPEIIGGITSGSNASTGYGIQTWGTSFATIYGRKFYECNKAVDISAEHVISRSSLIEACIIMGGGRNSKGEALGYSDTGSIIDPQYGIGTHGGCDTAIFRNNIIQDISIPFNGHGRNIFIEGNKVTGFLLQFAYIDGENYYIRNNHHDDGWSLEKDGTPHTYTGSQGINLFRCRRFVRVSNSGITGDLVITGNRVSINQQFLSFQSDTNQFGKILIKNNEIFLSAIPQAYDSVAVVGKEQSPIVIDHMRISDNETYRDDGIANDIPLFFAVTPGDNCRISYGGNYESHYSPELTSVANIASISISGATIRYVKSGKYVTIFGAVSIKPTTAGLLTAFNFPPPIATLLSTASGAAGAGATSNSDSCVIALTSAGNINVQLTPKSADVQFLRFTAMYDTGEY